MSEDTVELEELETEICNVMMKYFNEHPVIDHLYAKASTRDELLVFVLKYHDVMNGRINDTK